MPIRRQQTDGDAFREGRWILARACATMAGVEREELGRRRGSALIGWGSVGLYLGIFGCALDLFGLGFEAWFGLVFGLFALFLAGSIPFVWRYDRARETGEWLAALINILLLLACAAILVGIVVKGVF